MAHSEDYVVREFENHLDKTLLTKAEIGITTWRDMDRHLLPSGGSVGRHSVDPSATKRSERRPREREREVERRGVEGQMVSNRWLWWWWWCGSAAVYHPLRMKRQVHLKLSVSE